MQPELPFLMFCHNAGTKFRCVALGVIFVISNKYFYWNRYLYHVKIVAE